MSSTETREPPTEIADRADLPRGFVNAAWPLAAAALILLMLARACMPAAPPSAPPPLFDAAAAARQANAAALSALAALPSQPALPDLINALNLSVINFDSGDDVVPSEALDLLSKAAKLIAALPSGAQILITGHTDSVGSAADNMSLSLRRARAVRDALIRYGAPSDAFISKGLGDTQPVGSNDTEADRFRNRRIEFSPAR